MKARKIITIASLLVILVFGIAGMVYMYGTPVTYDGSKTDAYALYTNPSAYDTSDSDGIASVIVKENLDKTRSQNAVTAIVFDFRGYDTMGESFILLTAISGSMAILRAAKRKGGKSDAAIQEQSH